MVNSILLVVTIPVADAGTQAPESRGASRSLALPAVLGTIIIERPCPMSQSVVALL